MRTIKFRGKRHNGEWVYGSLVYSDHIEPAIYYEVGKGKIKTMDWCYVYPDTIGQFTGILDKNGKEIYEGDIVKFHSTRTRCINPDCDPAIRGYESVLDTMVGEVEFNDGVFWLDEVPLTYCNITIDDLDNIRGMLNATKENGWGDADGNIIDESILGLEVVGNIFDNLELLKGGEE